MTSLAREYNQENLILVKNLEYKFISDEIEKGSFGNEIRNATHTSNNAVSFFKKDKDVLLVSHYEPKEGGGLKSVTKVDKDLYEKYIKIKEANKLKKEEQTKRNRFRR